MIDRTLTHVEPAHQIAGMANELDKLTVQTVTHHCKFQLAVNQLTLFVEHLSSIATLDLLTAEQIQAHHIVLNVGRDCTNLLRCWAASVLENSCSTTPSDLCALATRLDEATRCLDEAASPCFDTADPQWLQFHVLECRAISASLEKHPDGPHPIIVEKLRSIGDFIAHAETDAPLSAARLLADPRQVPDVAPRPQRRRLPGEAKGRGDGIEVRPIGCGEKVKINHSEYTNHIKS
jgi:hypothetical protein